MIPEFHPILVKLHESDWSCHIVGSRLCGVYNHSSDYDVIVECEDDDWGRLKIWLEALKFECERGQDARLHDGGPWIQDRDPAPPYRPRVWIYPCDAKEAERRLDLFKALSLARDREGSQAFIEAMDHRDAWGTLWAVLARLGLK
jgi:hypothetical protein